MLLSDLADRAERLRRHPETARNDSQIYASDSQPNKSGDLSLGAEAHPKIRTDQRSQGGEDQIREQLPASSAMHPEVEVTNDAKVHQDEPGERSKIQQFDGNFESQKEYTQNGQ